MFMTVAKVGTHEAPEKRSIVTDLQVDKFVYNHLCALLIRLCESETLTYKKLTAFPHAVCFKSVSSASTMLSSRVAKALRSTPTRFSIVICSLRASPRPPIP